jgi:hypothetical protein
MLDVECCNTLGALQDNAYTVRQVLVNDCKLGLSVSEIVAHNGKLLRFYSCGNLY